MATNGNILATNGNILATPWPPNGNFLATFWQPAGHFWQRTNLVCIGFNWSIFLEGLAPVSANSILESLNLSTDGLLQYDLLCQACELTQTRAGGAWRSASNEPTPGGVSP